MRKCLYGVCLLGVALSLVGCSSARTPHVVIAPSYSYVQADQARGIELAVATDASSESRLAIKLPPMPAAPGFDTLVFVGDDTSTNR